MSNNPYLGQLRSLCLFILLLSYPNQSEMSTVKKGETRAWSTLIHADPNEVFLVRAVLSPVEQLDGSARWLKMYHRTIPYGFLRHLIIYSILNSHSGTRTHEPNVQCACSQQIDDNALQLLVSHTRIIRRRVK
ncbi:hypothetical protein F5051DRAFT_396769 [Lentinula edodes]|nr:hypothetical protein F5051DRAFT_396769 [Lentinula edodes]